MTLKHYSRRDLIIGAVIALLALVIGVGGYFYYRTAKELNAVKTELGDTQMKLAQSEENAQNLSDKLATEVYRNTLFSGQISQIANTVDKLDKLSKTDKELLQKYSKVYFLNENYVPESLAAIPADYLYEKDKEAKIHTKVLPYLEGFIKDARRNGVNLEIISAYRSFGEQSSLKASYTTVYGSGANKFSADQGYSEHQLGTTVDFTTSALGANFDKLDSTDAYKWLSGNAYKYGFILSYPKGNSYYQYEPWHWRFVGRSLALRLHEENQNFYDLDQRIIDNYLINIFD